MKTVLTLVDAEDVLCEIVDTRTMWAELDMPERALLASQQGRK